MGSGVHAGLLPAITFSAAVGLKGFQLPIVTKPLYPFRAACGISALSSKLNCPLVSVWPSDFTFSVICPMEIVWLLFHFSDFLSLLFVCHGSSSQMPLLMHQSWKGAPAPGSWGEHSLHWSRSFLITSLSLGCGFSSYEKLNIFTNPPLSFSSGAIKKQHIAFLWVNQINLS